ncbi:MAG: hypothetical protein NTX44_06500 [Ignavibacteriales bacterium]|nr:hypothetical protein [Ignavibacteriales bacterium]
MNLVIMHHRTKKNNSDGFASVIATGNGELKIILVADDKEIKASGDGVSLPFFSLNELILWSTFFKTMDSFNLSMHDKITKFALTNNSAGRSYILIAVNIVGCNCIVNY